MLEVKRLHFRYRPDSPQLKDIAFHLEEGRTLSLLGPNGAGKTTLLRCLLGLNRLEHGQVIVAGRDVSSLPAPQRARLMAYVPQASVLTFPYAVREVVLMGRLAHQAFGQAPQRNDYQAVERAMREMDIEDLADTQFQQLSGGEKQLVTIARALAQQARVLILDEPTASLDFANQARTLKLIRSLSRHGHTVLMSTHAPDHALLASAKVVLLKNGEVFAQGAPEAVVTSENLSRLYGVPARVAETKLVSSGRPVRVCIPLLDD
ncbi:MAG: ABC transporter ATP-binding protein [Pseudomonas sp.]